MTLSSGSIVKSDYHYNEGLMNKIYRQWEPCLKSFVSKFRHCGLVGSAHTLDGTGCEFNSWQCNCNCQPNIANESEASVGYISYPIFIEPTITLVPSGFFGYIWLDTKTVLKKELN